ncbi:MAG: uroporphyrinogen-III C-methyltransferase [Porticoccaceae bacterium]
MAGEREESAVGRTAADAGVAAPRARSWVRKLGLRLLVLAALAVVGYLGWQAYGQRIASRLTMGTPEPSAATPEPTAVTMVAIAGELSTLREKIDTQDREREQLRAALAALKAELDRETSAREAVAPDSDELAVMEVEHLLRLASQRLWEARSAASALALLERADALLAPLTDPTIAPVRAALVADMTALKLAGSVDVEGLYLRLSALQTAIATLNPAPRPVLEPTVSGTAPDTAPRPVGFWSRLLGNAGAALRRFSAEHLRVRTLDAPPPALLSRGQEARLQQYLELLLSQAQLAVLARQERIYRDSLARAVQLLDVHFGFDPRAPALRAELVGLQTESVALTLPDIASSRERVREYLARDERRRAGVAPR